MLVAGSGAGGELSLAAGGVLDAAGSLPSCDYCSPPAFAALLRAVAGYPSIGRTGHSPNMERADPLVWQTRCGVRAYLFQSFIPYPSAQSI
jgi:hypothetical protein